MVAVNWRFPGAPRTKALGEARIRVIAPDQRGYGADDRPERWNGYDIEHLTGDLVGLLAHWAIEKGDFVGHDVGRRRQSGRCRCGISTVSQAWVRHQHADTWSAHRPIRSRSFARGSATRCISCSSRTDARAGQGSCRPFEPTFDDLHAKPMPRPVEKPPEPAAPDWRVAKNHSGVSAGDRAYDAENSYSAHVPIYVGGREESVCRHLWQDRLHRPGINWYAQLTRNWQRSADLDHTVRVPSRMSMAEKDAVLPPSSPTLEKSIPDLEKYRVRDSAIGRTQEQA